MPERGPLVAVVDYGLGNLFSVERALRHIGSCPVITNNRDVILSSSRIVLPGVGAFGDAMKGLTERKLIPVLREAVNKGVPLLGICLGMQLLMSSSEEFGNHQGLDFLKGKVVRFKEPVPGEQFLKIPHIGWNSLCSVDSNKDCWKKTILAELEENIFMYFVHSYFVIPKDPDTIVAFTEYGREKFCSVIMQGNITGCQFHPERSSEAGLSIYRSFVFN
ncbi:MAG: imidazole glycerol phosphate synthase subunit HisH [Candidatus Firestonebacteria bacterium]